MNGVTSWITASEHWTGEDGVPHRLLEHLQYSFTAVAIAALIAIPLGLYIGHTGRGRFLVVNLVGAIRAIPSLGLLFVSVLLLGPRLDGDAAFLVDIDDDDLGSARDQTPRRGCAHARCARSNDGNLVGEE